MSNEFQELVDSHYQPLYRFAYSLAKNPDRASDLVQQTFCIWAQKGHQLKDRSKAKTWLFTTLYREQMGHARRSNKFPEQDIDEVYDLSTNEQHASRGIDAKRAVELLNSLDETYRAPLSLFFMQQHSYKEIAEILEIPMGTVMSRISRGKDQLKRLMAEPAESEQKIIAIDTKRKESIRG